MTFSSDVYRQRTLDLVEKLRAYAAGSSASFGEI
jgi:hypothetical protein